MFQRLIYTESHDEWRSVRERARSRANLARQRGQLLFPETPTLGAALVFTAPGIPSSSWARNFEWGAWSDGRELDWSKLNRFAGIRTLYRD